MKVLINGFTAVEENIRECDPDCDHCGNWCEYNNDTNCWREAD
jgi:hypothetical protein